MPMSQSEAEGCSKVVGVMLGIAVRSLIVVLCLNYAMTFWCTHFDKPQAWVWWYGVPFSIPNKLSFIVVVAAALTFIASFFI